MLIKNLPVETLPHVTFQDPALHVLNLMQDNRVIHLAVQHEGKFAGIISESILHEVDEELTIGDLQHLLLSFSVNQDEHFLSAVTLAVSRDLSVVPITDAEGNYQGSLEASLLLKYVAEFLHLQEPGGLIVVEVDPQHYSFSEISKIVETNDAQIIQLNTSKNAEKGTMTVTVRINKLEISDIVASFQRYEYNVKYYSGEELYENELKTNYENLMNYLNI